MKLETQFEGYRTGRLCVLKVIRGESRQKCICKCDCGNIVEIFLKNIKNSHVASCGCLKKEKMALANKSHGMSKTRTYRIWRSMRRRCYEKSHKYYDLYGGRGISVCERWMSSFENFFEDMGDPPTDGHSIDRIDCNGNYEKDNCRWATAKQQYDNRR